MKVTNLSTWQKNTNIVSKRLLVAQKKLQIDTKTSDWIAVHRDQAYLLNMISLP